MAFVSPVLKKLSDSCFRLTATLPVSGGSGTIGFAETTGTPDVTLEAPNWAPYSYDGTDITLQDLVEVIYVPKDVNANAISAGITKAGTTKENFLITITNQSGANTMNIEVYFRLAR